MNKAIGMSLLSILMGGIIYAGYTSYGDNKLQKQVQAKQQETSIVKGLVALDVEAYFQDQRVTDILNANKIKVDFKKVGSRDMGALMLKDKYDFAFASGVVAGNQILSTLKQNNVVASGINIFYSPMIVGSYKSTADILVNNHIAKYDAKNQVYSLDMSKIVPIMLSKGRWSDFSQNEEFNYNKSVLISTTDVRKSNSSAMFLALVSYVINGNEIITDKINAESIAMKVADLYKRQGYQENYVSGNFDDYKQGMGKTPLAFIYEYQLYQYAMLNKKLKDGMVVMYPSPTILNKEVFVAVSPQGKKLAELLMTNKQLQDIGIEYGFRVSELIPSFVKKAADNKLSVLAEVKDQIDPPNFEIMDAMIQTISTQLN